MQITILFFFFNLRVYTEIFSIINVINSCPPIKSIMAIHHHQHPPETSANSLILTNHEKEV